MLTLWLALAARRNCWREICFFLSNHCVPSRSDLVGTRLAPTLLVFSLYLGGGICCPSQTFIVWCFITDSDTSRGLPLVSHATDTGHGP